MTILVRNTEDIEVYIYFLSNSLTHTHMAKIYLPLFTQIFFCKYLHYCGIIPELIMLLI